MNTENKPRWLPIAPWMFLVVWSAGYGVAKLALESTTPLNLLALRFVGALLALVPFMLLLRPVWPSSNAIKDLIVVASFLQLGHFFCIYLGLSLGASAGLLALLAASQPVLVTIVTSLLNRRIPSARIWAGLLVGLVGAVWVIFIQGDFSDGVLLGAMLGFFAVVSLSLGQVYDKRQCPDCHPLLVYIIQYAFASIVCVPVALLFEGYQTEWNPSMIGALILSCIRQLIARNFLDADNGSIWRYFTGNEYHVFGTWNCRSDRMVCGRRSDAYQSVARDYFGSGGCLSCSLRSFRR